MKNSTEKCALLETKRCLDKAGCASRNLCQNSQEPINQSIVFRLRKRAEIRKEIPSRKSVQENKPDRLADLLEEAADLIESLMKENS